MIKALLSFLLGFLFFPAIYSNGQENFPKAFENFQTDPALQTASWSLTVINTENGQELFSHQSHLILKPASTLKTVTTATALAILGENFRFNTKLLYSGNITNGMLKGNIIIEGGGDPTLGFKRYNLDNKSSKVLALWQAAIAQKGITKIDGRIIGDGGIFETSTVSPKWNWEDIGNYYGAGASGLSFHENKYTIQFHPSENVGEAANIIAIEPAVNCVEFVNEVMTGPEGSGDQAYVFAAPYSQLVFVRGTVPTGSDSFTIKGAIPDPPLFTAQLLTDHLEKKGISCTKTASSSRVHPVNQRNKEILEVIQSNPLKDIVFWANKKSINPYCEHFVKMLAYHKQGFGSLKNGISIMTDYWENKGVDLSTASIYDGSGLSPENGISTFQLASILSLIPKESYYNSFNNSLSYAGVETDMGSLRGAMKNTPVQGNLRAKSGFISRVRSYSGYVENKCGDLLAFSFIVNNYNCSNRAIRKKMFEVMQHLVELE